MSSKLFWQVVLLILIASIAMPVVGKGVKLACYKLCKNSTNCPIMSKICPMGSQAATGDKSAS